MHKNLYEALERQSSEESRPYAVFDFDNTCVVYDTSEAALAYLAEHDLIRMPLRGLASPPAGTYSAHVFRHYHALLHRGAIKESFPIPMLIWAGYASSEVPEMALRVFDREGTRQGERDLFGVRIKTGLKRQDDVARLLSFLQDRGVALHVVSAAPQFLIEAAFAHFFPDVEAQTIGMQLHEVQGVFSDRLKHPLPMYEGKVENIRKHISAYRKPLLAVGDSLSDRAMLEYARTGAVAGSTSPLASMAQDNGWFVLHRD